jgi:hypothetical protein
MIPQNGDGPDLGDFVDSDEEGDVTKEWEPWCSLFRVAIQPCVHWGISDWKISLTAQAWLGWIFYRLDAHDI